MRCTVGRYRLCGCQEIESTQNSLRCLYQCRHHHHSSKDNRANIIYSASAQLAMQSAVLASVLRDIGLSVRPLRAVVVSKRPELRSRGIHWRINPGRGVKRHPWRRKLRHRNPRGTKVRKLEGTKFKIVATADVIF